LIALGAKSHRLSAYFGKDLPLKTLTFPKDFIWGAGTSAYQIEGAASLDGKGESIWDRFCRIVGKTWAGHTGEIACEHYQRFAQDIKLMKEIGLTHYRFSISWPRIMPSGSGTICQKGLDFYERLVDTLLANGIQPFPTLYHWDLPGALQDIGGWGNRDVAKHFASYAQLLVERLSDRVQYFATLNEPWCIAVLGHETGEHAPGARDKALTQKVGHNLLVAHGLATQAMRAAAHSQNNLQVGIVLILTPSEPESASPLDQVMAEAKWRKDCGEYMDPIFKGIYPDCVSERLPFVQEGDLQLAHQKLDFLGLNYYTRHLCSAAGKHRWRADSEYTEMGWEVHPKSFRNLLVRLSSEYDLPPIYITENGAAFKDTVAGDGHIYDQRRLSYFHSHLKQAHLAIQDGVDLRGYFAWSLMDNFEWAHGYSKRFGLIYVDFATQRRTIKESGRWYAKVIAANALEDTLPHS
jgi:beta-glucosidase